MLYPLGYLIKYPVRTNIKWPISGKIFFIECAVCIQPIFEKICGSYQVGYSTDIRPNIKVSIRPGQILYKSKKREKGSFLRIHMFSIGTVNTFIHRIRIFNAFIHRIRAFNTFIRRIRTFNTVIH